MKKPWSISTTVRNPERLRDFLIVLRQLEGEKFDKETQKKFQILLIKQRFYSPTQLPSKYRYLFDNPDKEITFDIAKEIFDYQNYKDPPMRGRQSTNPLNKLGFCIARENYGPIKITSLGNLFISEDYNISKVFLKSLLKLQFPNLWSERFDKEGGFNIAPFVSVLHLIKKVGSLTQNEFSIFVPTLTDYRLINSYAKIILNLRKEKNKQKRDSVTKKFLEDFYETKKLFSEQINNLYDYGDNIMRYFRLTKYFRFSKNTFGGWKIDFEPAREKEINQILSIYNGSPKKFKDLEDYLNYLSNINLPELPWENDVEKSSDIAVTLKKILKEEYDNLNEENKLEIKKEFDNLYTPLLTNLNTKEIETLSENIRILRVKIKQIKEGNILRKNTEELKKIINVIKTKSEFRKIDPMEFEYILFQTLKILNDELNLKANCILDDEGKPIGHAPGGKPDIEGYYKYFNAIFEVTLDTSRNQVYRESMPIMRHLRDFENNNSDKETYCIFIAPKIHDDTNNYFWYAVKHEFEGRKQKIISLDLSNYIEILEFFIFCIEEGNKFDHNKLKQLFEIIIKDAERKTSSIEWLKDVTLNIQEWKKKILT